MIADRFKWVQKKPYYSFSRIQAEERQRKEREIAGKLACLPWHWSKHVARELGRRGGVESAAAVGWFDKVTGAAVGRLPLSATDDDIRAAAKRAAADGLGVAALAGVRAGEKLRGLLAYHCERWGIAAPGPEIEDGPAIKRMLCARWWLRRLRRAHGRRCDGAAIQAGVVRRGLWPYASQDCVERRKAQRKRNARALAEATVNCAETGESLPLADVVEGSIANPAVKRAELMVRINGCDEIAKEGGMLCEFWTLTTPSRMHSQRITGAVSDVNPAYDGTNPREAQQYLSKVWARARAAWKRRGLEVFGLRTAEPHHDSTPHWHLIAYGRAYDLRYARRLLRVYALRDSRDEPGAKKHRFRVDKPRAGCMGAAYATKYAAKNIDGFNMQGDIDHETGRKVKNTVERVDSWAACWGIRQFQFFGCPSISLWRALRRLAGPFAVVGSELERARQAADDSNFAAFWREAARGGLALIYRAKANLTAYGDVAAPVIAGVEEQGGRRALFPEKTWSIQWAGAEQAPKKDDSRRYSEGFAACAVAVVGAVLPLGVKPWKWDDRPKAEPGGVAFGLPRLSVNNCTGPEGIAAALFA
jgi:hypothetical protein